MFFIGLYLNKSVHYILVICNNLQSDQEQKSNKFIWYNDYKNIIVLIQFSFKTIYFAIIVS